MTTEIKMMTFDGLLPQLYEDFLADFAYADLTLNQIYSEENVKEMWEEEKHFRQLAKKDKDDAEEITAEEELKRYEEFRRDHFLFTLSELEEKYQSLNFRSVEICADTVALVIAYIE